MIDQRSNFINVAVAGTHTDTATTISLESGEASELPDPANGEYNLVWFNEEENTPDQDSNVEIVRVTAVDTSNDEITVARGQEGTTAVAHDSTPNYRMILSATAKTFSDIDTGFVAVDGSNQLTNYWSVGNEFRDVSALGIGGTPSDDIEINTSYPAASFIDGSDGFKLKLINGKMELQRLTGYGTLLLNLMSFDLRNDAVDMEGNVLKNIPDPSGSSHAATQGWVSSNYATLGHTHTLADISDSGNIAQYDYNNTTFELDANNNFAVDVGNGLDYDGSSPGIFVEVGQFAGKFLSRDSNFSSYDPNLGVNLGSGLEGDGNDNIKTSEKGNMSEGHTEWADGLTDEEIFRIPLQSGETLHVERLGFYQKGGGSSADASIEVYDLTASSSIASQTLGGETKDAGSSGTGNTVIVRMDQATGGPIEATTMFHYRIEGA